MLRSFDTMPTCKNCIYSAADLLGDRPQRLSGHFYNNCKLLCCMSISVSRIRFILPSSTFRCILLKLHLRGQCFLILMAYFLCYSDSLSGGLACYCLIYCDSFLMQLTCFWQMVHGFTFLVQTPFVHYELPSLGLSAGDL